MLEEETGQTISERKINGLKELGLFSLGQCGLKTLYKNIAPGNKLLKEFIPDLILT